MSQFLLAEGVDRSLLPHWVKTIPAEEDPFLSGVGAKLFGKGKVGNAVAVRVDNEDFDTIFLAAQRAIGAGESFERTRLRELLLALVTSARRLALWYGDDFNDLEVVHDPESLQQIVRKGLSLPSVEAYVMYEKGQ
ncbi:MAG: hypothetical protein U1E89_04295 [Burkholderiaceae bacterium]